MRKLASILLLLAIAVTAKAQDLGLASVYSPKFQSKFTANGESFSHSELTASHRRLPFGTVVRVTRLDNGSAVVVRITDRGPFVNGYITNLSKAAALKIGMLGENTETKVKIEVIREAKTQTSVVPKLKGRIREPPQEEVVEVVTSKSIKERNIPSEYRAITPAPNTSTNRFPPSMGQKKKVRL